MTNPAGIQPGEDEAAPAAERVGLFRGLLGESAVYGLGGVTNQALSVVLVPIYARELGVADYGTVAILNATLSLATLVATMALPQAFFRAYLHEAGDDADRTAALHTHIGLRLLVSAGVLLLLVLMSVPLAIVLFGRPAQWPFVALIAAIAFFDSLNLVPLSQLRAERRPTSYALLASSRAVLGSVLIVVFVVGLDQGVIGVLFGSLCSSVIAALAGVAVLVRRRGITLGIDTALARRMVAFSMPLVPASIAAWGLNLADRYILQWFDGRTPVGIYSAGYTVGLAMNVLAIAPFTLSWGAASWSIAKRPDARHVISRVLTGFIAIASFGAVAVGAFGTDLIRWLLTPEFEAGRYVAPFSAFAMVFLGAFAIVSTGLNLENQTRRVPVVTGVAAVTNVILNFLLIPYLGYMGAAISTLLSYALLAIAAGWVSQRYYAVPWETGRLVALVSLAMALVVAALAGPDHIAWRAAWVVAYPVLVLGLRIVPLSVLRNAGGWRR